jgi:hypothetical protein
MDKIVSGVVLVDTTIEEVVRLEHLYRALRVVTAATDSLSFRNFAIPAMGSAYRHEAWGTAGGYYVTVEACKPSEKTIQDMQSCLQTIQAQWEKMKPGVRLSKIVTEEVWDVYRSHLIVLNDWTSCGD